MLEVRADFLHPYDRSRGWFVDESDFPGPRTMSAAAAWIDDHSRHHDRLFLFVDEFDPHEPFDTPEPWASRYDDEWDVAKDGPRLVWPPYATDVVANGYLSEREATQTRANYGSKLSMIDHWFGKVLDAIDRQRLWDDTAIIVCTDHGLFLGERDIWGKPSLPFFEPFGHTPLLVSWPGVQPGSCGALTTNVDIHATVRAIFDAPSHAYRLHGRSLRQLLDGPSTAIRQYALMGIWGCEFRSLTAVTNTSARRTRRTDRCRCGRTVGPPSLPTTLRWRDFQTPTDARSSTTCPQPIAPSSASPTTRLTAHRCSRPPGKTARAFSTTWQTTPTSARTAPANGSSVNWRKCSAPRSSKSTHPMIN